MKHLLIFFASALCAKSLPIGSISGDVDINLNHVAKNIQIPTISPKAFTVLPGFPNSGRTRAVLEQETLLSQVDSKYTNLQQAVANIYNPKPVVDTISEEDKYGNDGEKFKSVGRVLVNGYESFSNFLNALFEIPMEKAKQIGKQITANLNAIGGKLVGL
ncbi:uncharacterized protein LOC123683954 [Harmonia axyridis]|uniref:uncharacterized protein LOC123683954 n=1 Tax=Harmonia axyridis TaxID=115357 RepID=UPI001E278E88|nr:uncharacterized protein LOC123683954 [Harmonia axyridis]